MENSFKKIVNGYRQFRDKYATGDNSIMQQLSHQGQQPEVMIVACCDSRVDPALILQCDPGELFIVRNVANIIPPYEADERHHDTSAALEFGICYLRIKHLIILGHSQCGGIAALLNRNSLQQNDFISPWVSLLDLAAKTKDTDSCAKEALTLSYNNCLTFPWIKQRLEQTQDLIIHRWFFNIKEGEIHAYNAASCGYQKLS